MHQSETHVYFWGQDDFLSNWHPVVFSHKRQCFSSSEQCFMWLKAEFFFDRLTASRILQTDRPSAQKTLGRDVRGFDEDAWRQVRAQLMFEACFAKFAQNPDLQQALLATGNRTLVEASPYDRIWGVGLSIDDPLITDSANWKGQNLLGLVLERVRSRIREV